MQTLDWLLALESSRTLDVPVATGEVLARKYAILAEKTVSMFVKERLEKL